MAAAISKVKRETFSKTKSTIKNNFIQGRFEAGFLRIFAPRSRPCFIMRYQSSPVKILVHYISDIFCHHLRHILIILLGSLLLPTTILGRSSLPGPRPGLEGGNVSLRGHVLIADVVKYVCRRPLAAWSGPDPSTAAPGIYEEW